ncbi:LAQU0S07e02608g1_1 [Lachancea quebecensis]|uniref:LAQU0S07e02608g1_1 n=1 Tax=Lachancea quebecensis TaxID=1654605 RepID=A0A0N7MLP9_9SACH|nr:LAQU0S07e02608g1_1 [Lachancea quebecensis]
MSATSGVSNQAAATPSAQPTMKSSKGSSSVETSVTKLLMSTKHLLQSLTHWSKGLANERNVSDAYVQLGNDFKLLTKQFSHAGLEVADLGDVPSNLRQVLEVALREQPSEKTLDKYLPRIREIVVTLLEKLKVKQSMLKGMRQTNQSYSSRNSRSSSTVSVASGRSTLSNRETRISASSSACASPHRSPAATSTPHKLEKRSSMSNSRPAEEPNAALAQLKNSDSLQRRASKRFSAYHIAKLTHQSASEAAAMVTPPHPVEGHTREVEIPPSMAEKTANDPELQNNVQLIPQELEKRCVNVFLKLDGKVKKCTLDLPTSFTTLRLLFVERFTYTPGSINFPEIYIKEPSYEEYYELEASQLDKIKDGSVISLQSIENAQYPATTMSLDRLCEEFEKRLKNHQAAISAEIQGLRSSEPHAASLPNLHQKNYPRSATEIEDIKRQLSILNQIHNAKRESLEANVAHILEKVAKFKSLSFNSSTTTNRVYMEKSHMKLSEVSDNLLGKVDDLQDVIEALRKDVAVRGSKPSRKKLEGVKSELDEAQANLDRMQEYLSIEKPNWKKIWESELEKVCEEQQFLTLQEELALDFKEDLEKVRETFGLVKMCCEEKEKNPKKSLNPILPIAKPGTFNQLREAVLSEVQSLHPDHAERVEAIEKAEKLRVREKGYRDNSAFEDELGSFVVNNNFKKSGGINEIEKLRRQKDEDNIRATFRPSDF